MKVLILQDDFPPFSIGGAGVIAYNLAREYQKDGHEVLVVTTVRDRTDAGMHEYDGLRVYRIATSYDLRFQAYVCLWNPTATRPVRSIFAEFRPNVVHAHNVHAHLSYRSLALARKAGARVILTMHDVMSFNYSKLTEFIDPNNLSIPETFNYRIHPWRQLREQRFRYNPFRNVIIRHILSRNVDTTVAVSAALKQALNDNGIRCSNVIHNGIAVDEWRESAETAHFKKHYGIGETAMLFGGRISGVKGARQILEAVALTRKTVGEVQLLVMGKNDEGMRAYANTIGVAESVIFLGLLSGANLHAAYHASALVAVPTLSFDSFPTMNLEAFACGKPVIATCFGGSREIVEDGVSGYIVNPFDTKALAEKIITLLSDPKKAEAMGRAGHARVIADFSLSSQAARYEALFSNPSQSDAA